MNALNENTKFLVVDDSATMLRIITKTINRLGYTHIVTASDGEQGLIEYKKDTPDVICTDWAMPYMNGFDFIKEIRKLNEDIPILVVTTEGGKAEVITALKIGATNYIIKPFTPQILKEKFEAMLD